MDKEVARLSILLSLETQCKTAVTNDLAAAQVKIEELEAKVASLTPKEEPKP